MVEKIIKKVEYHQSKITTSPSWSSFDENRWRTIRGLQNLAELEAHFREYAPRVFRRLEKGSITRGEATELIDTHCYQVFRYRPEKYYD